MEASITLDPPYRIGEAEFTKEFVGWCTIENDASPNIQIAINGEQVPCSLFPMPAAKAVVGDRPVRGISAKVDFRSFYNGRPPTSNSVNGFLLNVSVTTDGQTRNFEYEVKKAWLRDLGAGDATLPRPVPPEHLQIRVTGAAAGGFCKSGEITAGQIANILKGGGLSISQFKSILDFGCGSGRVLPAVREQNPTARFHGSDIDPEAIGWCADFLGDRAIFKVNGHEPPLPFPDKSFDFIYSISIFTHLPEDMQFAWLADLNRVLKPGGVLLTTVLNPFAYALPQQVVDAAKRTGFAYFGDADETSGLPSFYRLAYHTHEYVDKNWTKYFKILAKGHSDLNNTQDSVLCEKRK